MVMQRCHPELKTGCHLLADGVAERILDWHKKRGFANVPETVLKKLAISRKAPELPPAAALAGDEEGRLVARLTLSLDPNATVEDMQAYLAKRTAFETTDQHVEAIDQQVMDDTLSASDRKEAMSRQKMVTAMLREREAVASGRRAILNGMNGVLKHKKKKTHADVVAKRGAKYSKDFGEKWWNTMDPGDWTDVIYALKPTRAAVHKDMHAGRSEWDPMGGGAGY